MSNLTKKVVLFTIRDIEIKPLFKDVEPKTTDSLISYFLSFSDFGPWLISNVPSNVQEDIFDINSFKKTIEEKENEFNNAINELSSLFKDDEDKQFFSSLYQELAKSDVNILLQKKALFQESMTDVTLSTESQKTAYSMINSILDTIKANQETKPVFTIDNYYDIRDIALNETNTYCDKGGGEVKVKHRLGMYSKEEDDNAVCAIYPWLGDYEEDHDESWTKMLVGSILAFYPKAETIILVCHDIDYKQFEGRDFVVSKDINIKGADNTYKYTFDKRISIPLVVFQHSNQNITSALLIESPKEIYTLMENYVFGFVKIQDADKDEKNAEAHKEKYNSKGTTTN